MASWTYSDYVTYTRGSVTYLERLRLHIQEVVDQISTEMANDAKSESANNLTAYRRDLEAKLERAENMPGSRTTGGISKVRFGRAL